MILEMGTKQDPFCIFDKIYENDDYETYKRQCDVLEHRFSYYHVILKLNDCFIKYDDNEDCNEKYTYNRCGDNMHATNLVYELKNELKLPMSYINNEIEHVNHKDSSNLLFREAHIVKWNRIEEWF